MLTASCSYSVNSRELLVSCLNVFLRMKIKHHKFLFDHVDLNTSQLMKDIIIYKCKLIIILKLKEKNRMITY